MGIKTIIILIVLIVLGWYFIAPSFDVVEADEPLPVADEPIPVVESAASVKIMDDSALDHMDDSMKAKFMEELDDVAGDEMPMEDEMPDDVSTLMRGTFKPKAHDVQGTAKIINSGGKKILRFEDFETTNGPRLHIYLSADLGASDYVDLGKIKATKGNVNYELEESVDTEKYNKVLVWCVPFKVLFSYAELS
jgi:hypothetical protein